MVSTNTKLAEALAQFEAALLFAYPEGARGAAFDSWNKARQALAAHEAEQALPLKDRPDFIAGYDAGLKDGRACERRDAAEQAAQAVPQWRKIGASQWWDGHPDHEDGGGPYESRTLYTHAAPSMLRRMAALKEVAAHEQAQADDWQHLKPYGYAPGNYMSRCRTCGDTPVMDKRAITCRPCAEAKFAASQAQAERVGLTDEQIRREKPVCADWVSFRAGVRCAERIHGVGK